MAAISSRAIRKGDKFILNGQKIWSTRAIFADWVFGLFRSDPTSSRHHGLSYILVPLNTPGITVRPIRAINGREHFAEIFFDDVEVPAENLLGAEGKGWHVAMATAGFERGLLLRSPARYQRSAQKLVDLYLRNQVDADRDHSIRDAVLRAWQGRRRTRCPPITRWGACTRVRRSGPRPAPTRSSGPSLDIMIHETAMRILGARAELIDDAEANEWLEGFLFSQAGPIYAGSNEIQRNIIAQRMLGLPKS